MPAIPKCDSGAGRTSDRFDRQLAKQQGSADGALPSRNYRLCRAQSPTRRRRLDRNTEVTSTVAAWEQGESTPVGSYRKLVEDFVAEMAPRRILRRRVRLKTPSHPERLTLSGKSLD